jgi:hypothetical protein
MAQTLEERLKKIERGDAELLKLFPSLVKASGNAMYTSDFMIIGAIKRTLSLSQGFRTHIRDRNFICAGTLMRAMLDTALRINALGLVRDPEALAGAVMRGDRLDKLKGRDNQRLSDAYLSKKLAEIYPWVAEVYRQLCEFGHFSSRHIFASVTSADDNDRKVSFQISAQDPMRPEEDYFEIVEGFYEVMRITGTLAAGWHMSRRALATASMAPATA